jgi:hypothetical protein
MTRLCLLKQLTANWQIGNKLICVGDAGQDGICITLCRHAHPSKLPSCVLCAVQVVQGKMAFMSSLAGMHPLGKAISDPEAALAGLMGKMGQFKHMISNPGQGHFKAMMTNMTTSG